ncbi:hypothetical protein BJ742DRAFT_734809 [Cladochytrium replicatum]|nr:hypothetical protein BJ742DRAFT_734809 [Cladochytrium replicatum]
MKRHRRSGCIAPVTKRRKSAAPKSPSRISSTAPNVSSLRLGKPHPLGVLPWGNFLMAKQRDCRASGLGSFSLLPDEFIADLLVREVPVPRVALPPDQATFNQQSRVQPTRGIFSAQNLCRLSQVSKVFYCFVVADDVWRTLTIRDFGDSGGFAPFAGTWRRTYAITHLSRNSLSEDVPHFPSISVRNFYSDHLFAAWRCTSIPLEDVCDPSHENIERRSKLSLDEFISQYAEQNKPVVITDVVTEWPAFKKWTDQFLVSEYGGVQFRAEAVDLTLKDYFTYAHTVTLDESPLYLFDKNFANPEKTGMADDYVVPSYFQEDLFSVLGERRPDYRWVIIGPARSGSTFHVDPNSTHIASAWNAVITGSKKWIMFPPEVIPPGVFPSGDGSEVTSPVSIGEWLLNYYREARSMDTPPLECVCRAGEVIFVPNGWWHLVVNLEPSIAITQNFVCKQNLRNTLKFLRFKREQVSGWISSSQLMDTDYIDPCDDACPSSTCDLFESFAQALREKRQDLVPIIEEIEQMSDREVVLADGEKSATAGLWTKLNVDEQCSSAAPVGYSFSFGFGDDGNDE